MKIIKNGFALVANLLGEQEIIFDSKYRPISFCALVKKDDYSVAYNTLTGELVFIDEREETILSSESVAVTDDVSELIKHWFLVPVEHDDMQLRNEIVDFHQLLKRGDKQEVFVVFPTTDCNARCFYCFEHGHRHLHMSDEIARDSVKYMLDHSKGKVSLKWFGGEPLYNDRAIDIISQGLCDAGVEYDSHMVTNAYLFDDERVKKAVKLWHLKTVQVTLDGTENNYYRIKAYIYKDVSNPFGTVLDNIERLLKADITVFVRLNMDNNNYEDLYGLVDLLHERFSMYKKFYMYSQMLYELSDRPNSIRTGLERKELSRKWLELEEKIYKYGMKHIKPLPKAISGNACMADANSSILILPDGHLGKCEHYIDDRFVGDIYSGITDNAEVERFKVRADFADICKGCKVYPTCIKLRECPTIASCGVCDEAMRYSNEHDLYKSIEKYMNKYLAGNHR